MNASKNTGLYCPLISVVVPVYNGERYLRGTIDSLLAQDFSAFELLCVDDCSTDEGFSILKEYESIDGRVRVFQTHINLGIAPKAINYVAKHVRGQYYVYASQDDLFSRDWLSAMHARITETGADAVLPDVVFYYEGRIDCRRLSGVRGDKSRIISGKEAFELSLDWTIPGNALWKSIFLSRYRYFEFSVNADEYTARYWFLHCASIAFSGGVFYYRQDNSDAITKKISAKTFEMPYTAVMLWKLALDWGCNNAVQSRLLSKAVSEMLRLNAIKRRYQGSQRPIDLTLELLRRESFEVHLKSYQLPFFRKVLIRFSVKSAAWLNVISFFFRKL